MADENVDLGARPRAVTILVVAAIGALLPFVVTVSSSSITSVDGHSTVVFRDWVAVGGGGVAIAFGLLAVVFSRRARDTGLVAGSVVCAALGGYQVARGFGAFVPRGETTTTITTTTVTPSAESVSAPPTTPETCTDVDACDRIAEALKKTDAKGYLVAKERGCKLGGKYSCSEAGQVWDSGGAGTTDHAKAAALFEQGCTLGSEDGCTDAGVAYLTGEGVAKDAVKGLALMTKGCEGGTMVACKNLAVRYRDGIDVAADPAKSFAYAVHGCDEGHSSANQQEAPAQACDIAGVALYMGTGIAKDTARAVDYFKKACGYAPAWCYDLAVVLDEGKVIKQDQVQARALYIRACDADSGGACNNLSFMLARGEGGPKDAAGAKALTAKACKLGQDGACKR